MLMILPGWPVSMSFVPTARVVRNVPLRFVSSTKSDVAAVVLTSGVESTTPELFTRDVYDTEAPHGRFDHLIDRFLGGSAHPLGDDGPTPAHLRGDRLEAVDVPRRDYDVGTAFAQCPCERTAAASPPPPITMAVLPVSAACTVLVPG